MSTALCVFLLFLFSFTFETFALQRGRQCNLNNVQLDIVFVLDSSGGTDEYGFAGEKAAILGLLHLLPIGQHEKDTRVAFVNMAKNVQRVSDLTTYKSREEAIAGLVEMRFLNSIGLKLDQGITEATRIFDSSGQREGIPRLIVLFSNEAVNCATWPVDPSTQYSACVEANRTEARGISIASVELRYHETTTTRPMHLGNYTFRNDRDFLQEISDLFCTISPFEPSKNSHFECPCVLHSLWLDIIFIIDASNTAGQPSFDAQRAAIISLMHRIYVNQIEGMSSRVAFITLGGDTVHRVSNLTSYEYTAEAIQVLAEMEFLGGNSQNKDTRAKEALSEAVKTFEQFEHGGHRKNAKNVVVFFLSNPITCDLMNETKSEVCRQASNMKNDGYVIMTVDLNPDWRQNAVSSNIGSDCFALRNEIHFMRDLEENLCKANCFCTKKMTQFKKDDTCQIYGECVYLHETPTGALSAQAGCAIQNMQLANVLSSDKDTFLTDLAFEEGAVPFIIGLYHTPDGKLVWNSGESINENDFNVFADGRPDLSKGNCTSVQLVDGKETAWVSIPCSYVDPAMYYFCQTETCDTNKYCEKID